MIESQVKSVSLRIHASSFSRALRAAPPARHDASGLCDSGTSSRERKGIVGRIPSAWRRISPGTNRISCLGIWRAGTRREAARVNRMGATDWHRPYRAGSQMQLRVSADMS